ncbi:hypothetical protein JJD41_13105 [Oxynema sp. CENA135]|uniref:hypothetical protein n=1 Tax=Oxynema sp. CENA135 TaxID=984206 RepID=UPI00190AF3FC|nr:hypothetical protein [Oxynema sp. CENA135]MBK4730795.1 hypothetical protein [Oxynema sp. CENA135]
MRSPQRGSGDCQQSVEASDRFDGLAEVRSRTATPNAYGVASRTAYRLGFRSHPFIHRFGDRLG